MLDVSLSLSSATADGGGSGENQEGLTCAWRSLGNIKAPLTEA